MQSRIILFYLFIAFCGISFSAKAQCLNKITSFKEGEKVSYQIYYNWGFIWVAAGEAIFTTEKTKFAGKTVFKLKGEGFTYPKYDALFKVRDKFESYVDTINLKPYRYLRDTKEGSHLVYNDTYFNYYKKKIVGYYRENDKPIKTDTIALNNCVFDVLSMIYYARNIDFSKNNIGDVIPIVMYLDNKIYSLTIRYLGKETIKTETGLVACIKFNPKLIPGTMFKDGDEMTVWVSDDENKIPVLIEAPILIGQVKAKLKSATGTIAPFNQ
jgi:hypothetical protein